MSANQDPFPTSGFASNNFDPTQKVDRIRIANLAERFVDKWVRPGQENTEPNRIKMTAFIGLITGHGNAEVGRILFDQIALRVPELRQDQSVNTHSDPLMAHLLDKTRSFRPPARVADISPELIWLSRGVAIELQRQNLAPMSNQLQAELANTTVKGIEAAAKPQTPGIGPGNLPRSRAASQLTIKPPTPSRQTTHQRVSSTGTSGTPEESGSLSELRSPGRGRESQ